MRNLGMALACTLAVACGSTSTERGTPSGTGGAGAAAGTDASAGTGGTDAGAGIGGTGASGGELDHCCGSDAECPTQQCVSGLCLPIPADDTCWSSNDCAEGKTCAGDCVCPCGFELCSCDADLGKCVDYVEPAEGACCSIGDETCGDAGLGVCVDGVCKEAAPGECWNDDQCELDDKCMGEFVCPCWASCPDDDVPGSCFGF